MQCQGKDEPADEVHGLLDHRLARYRSKGCLRLCPVTMLSFLFLCALFSSICSHQFLSSHSSAYLLSQTTLHLPSQCVTVSFRSRRPTPDPVTSRPDWFLFRETLDVVSDVNSAIIHTGRKKTTLDPASVQVIAFFLKTRETFINNSN